MKPGHSLVSRAKFQAVAWFCDTRETLAAYVECSMAISQNDLDWFAARLLIAVYDTNTEHRMSVQVSALADMVRNAKRAIATASDASARLNGSAQRVVQRVAEVEAMVNELNAAEVELAEALGATSNGGPPLDDTPASSPPLSIDASLRQVEANNSSVS